MRWRSPLIRAAPRNIQPLEKASLFFIFGNHCSYCFGVDRTIVARIVPGQSLNNSHYKCPFVLVSLGPFLALANKIVELPIKVKTELPAGKISELNPE